MDMNWTDEIRDPEPLKRPIYNAADYDTRHGDPYYREHSTHDGSVEVEIRQDCPCDAPALVDLWKHRLRSRYAESSAD